MRHALYSQSYKDGDKDVTCWWGISGNSMTFLVIDATGKPTTDAAFDMTTEWGRDRGILEAGGGIRCIDLTGTVVHLTEDCVVGTQLPMSASDLQAYLDGGKYPLSLSGAKSYIRDRSSSVYGTYPMNEKRSHDRPQG